jgi:hypothetical protein
MRNDTRVPTHPTPIQHSPGVPSQSNRQEGETKGIQIGKETVKVSLFGDDKNLLFWRPKKLYPKTPRHHKQIHQCGRIQNQLKKSLAFLYTNNEQIEKEYMKTIPFTIASKKIKYLGVNLTKYVNDSTRRSTNP